MRSGDLRSSAREHISLYVEMDLPSGVFPRKPFGNNSLLAVILKPDFPSDIYEIIKITGIMFLQLQLVVERVFASLRNLLFRKLIQDFH